MIQSNEPEERIAISIDASMFKKLAAIGERIRTQDNRITEQPIFVVRQKYRIYGVDPDHEDHTVVWIDEDNGCEAASAEENANLEAKYQDGEETPEGWRRTAYKEEWQIVTACFTEAACQEYIRINGHNLRSPKDYVISSFRNEEFQTVRAFLQSIDLKTSPIAGEPDPHYATMPAEQLARQCLWLRDISDDAGHREELYIRYQPGTECMQCIPVAEGGDLKATHDMLLHLLTSIINLGRGIVT